MFFDSSSGTIASLGMGVATHMAGAPGPPRAFGRRRPHLGRRHAHVAHIALGDVLLQRAVGNVDFLIRAATGDDERHEQ